MAMRLSVVIPTHNRPQSLRRSLDALEAQTLARDRFEVLAVDDGSSPEHRKEIRQFRAPFGYRLLEKAQGGLPTARNVGAERATGDVLLFLDDDVVPHPDLLLQHLRTHEEADEPLAVVGALPYPDHVELDCFLWYLEQSGHYDLYRNPKKYAGGAPPLPPLNGNSSVRRSAFFDVGRYDERFSSYGSEDLELGYRLNKAGVRFVYNPQAVGYHDHIKDFPRFCHDMELAGESLIGIYRIYPEIKAAKKIDVVEDRLSQLHGKKKLIKLIMATTMALPWVLALPRAVVRVGTPYMGLRRVLFPLYRWVAHHHYAVGMRRGLDDA
ncbi:MAG: glycosyltransferase family 2 protein [bacterium]|nr:glycosyltransferase family 2 protein [bacterium]